MRKMPAVKSYWWREASKPRNFGDELAPLILEHFTDVPFVWDTISRSSVITVGSILEHVPPLWDGFILGAGKLFEFSRLHLHTRTAKILALRGPLSARGVYGDYAYGDPGLLADELVGPQDKKWDLGILPHWQDDELAIKFKGLIKPPHTTKIISPADDPLTILKQIGACHRLVTSSLHGMVVADAFGGIPRRVEICSGMEKDGGDFKFRDYSAAINTPFEIGKMIEPSRFYIEDAKFALYDAYQELNKELGSWH